MNLLPYRSKHKKYWSSNRRRAMFMVALACLAVFQGSAPRLWRAILQKQRNLSGGRRHLASLAPSIDGVRAKSLPTGSFSQRILGVRQALLHGFWRPVSVTSAFLLGVFSTGAVYHTLQASWAAESVPGAQVAGASAANSSLDASAAEPVVDEQVLTDEDIANLTDLIVASQEQKTFEQKLREMVQGYPIEAMVPDILRQDRVTAAFLVSIAKKESNWGKRVPVLDGQDCFNYWGYRGIRDRMGTGGHTCFESRQDAVNTVAKRIKTLIERNHLSTPKEMIVWKCGSTCSGHSRESVLKWISDVEMYFSQLNQKENGA